jgi:hypothetical protein
MIGEPHPAQSLPSTPTAHPSASTTLFSLRKIGVSHAHTVEVDFKTVKWEEAGRDAEGMAGREFKAHPVFNDDGCYYTPSFMLHQDKVAIIVFRLGLRIICPHFTACTKHGLRKSMASAARW